MCLGTFQSGNNFAIILKNFMFVQPFWIYLAIIWYLIIFPFV